MATNLTPDQIQNLTTSQGLYDTINNHGFRNWSDASKSGFFNFLLNEKANQHEIDMWKMQNEYNTPEAQMKRLVDAGLNPNLAYNMANSGNASSMPGTHVANMTFGEQGYKMQKAQLAMNAINQFASGVMDLISTGAELRNNLQNVYPMQANEAYMARMNREAFDSSNIGTLDDFTSLMGAAPETDLYPLYKNEAGQQVYLHAPKLKYSPRLMDTINRFSKSQIYNLFQQDFQKHLSNMFASEESLKDSTAAIQKYIKEVYQSIDPEFKGIFNFIMAAFGGFSKFLP